MQRGSGFVPDHGRAGERGHRWCSGVNACWGRCSRSHLTGRPVTRATIHRREGVIALANAEGRSEQARLRPNPPLLFAYCFAECNFRLHFQRF
jgi:hypothetical protein